MIKIFDFNDNNNPSGIIGRPRDFSWPCLMYRITIPKVKPEAEKTLNPFEICILKLLACGSYDGASQLAEETGLPPDFIENILLRLYDNGYIIDKNFNLSEDALTEITKHDEQREIKPTGYYTCVIFRECIGGKLLPIIKEANLRCEEVNEKGEIVKSKNKSISLHRLYTAPKDAPKSGVQDEPNVQDNPGVQDEPGVQDVRVVYDVPSVQDVISILRTMGRRKRTAKGALHIPSTSSISVSRWSERCFLRVRIAIQRNSRSDWRIINPFGSGWSPELESSYNSYLEKNENETEYLQDWQRKNSRELPKNPVNDDLPVEPYDTQENRSRYPQLIRTLNLGHNISNGTEYGIDAHAALEWALYYALRNCETTKKFIQLLLFYTIDGRTNLVQKAIESLNLPDNNIRRRKILDNTLQTFQNEEKAEMNVVLPITLLVSQENPDYPFNMVIQKIPDCLTKIEKIESKRNEKDHGNSVWATWAEIFGDDDYAFMQEVISTLLPTVVFSETSKAKTSDGDSVADIRLNARISLQSYFGVVPFERMDNILQNELFQVEMFRNCIAANKEFDAIQCINNLYAAAQCACRLFLANERSQDLLVQNSSLINLAIQNAQKVGWDSFPQSLRSVQSKRIEQTFRGDDKTLGASVVCILLLDIDRLHQLASSLPDFLSDIDNLLVKRIHGNAACMMQKEELDSLVNRIYKIIRTIMEV